MSVSWKSFLLDEYSPVCNGFLLENEYLFPRKCAPWTGIHLKSVPLIRFLLCNVKRCWLQGVLDYIGHTHSYSQTTRKISAERLEDAWVMLIRNRLPRRFHGQLSRNHYDQAKQSLEIGCGPSMLAVLSLALQQRRIILKELTIHSKQFRHTLCNTQSVRQYGLPCALLAQSVAS